jgi:YebC/PmpR family DNA-binding regulatory protein
MAGHSRWAQIKRQKAVTDAKRGQIFTKLGRELTIASQHGGADPSANFRLDQAMAKAKAANMPKDRIERAIQRGVGGNAEDRSLEEITYEGYATDGAGLLIEVVTDNRNRSVAEIRTALNRLGGTLAESGSVAWQFANRGAIEVRADGVNPEDIELSAIDMGAVDVEHTDDFVHVYTEASELALVKTALENIGYSITTAELTMIPTAPMLMDDSQTSKIVGMVEQIEELDDVRRVHTNVEVSDTLLEHIDT